MPFLYILTYNTFISTFKTMTYNKFSGSFKSIHNNNKYYVDILIPTDTEAHNYAFEFSFEQPCVIKQDQLEDICGIQLSTMTLNISITSDLLLKLSTNSYTAPVFLRDSNDVVVWAGYLNPYVYNQTALPVSDLTLTCVSPLNILKYVKFGSDSIGSLSGSVADMITTLYNFVYSDIESAATAMGYTLSKDIMTEMKLNVKGDETALSNMPLSDVFVSLNGMYKQSTLLDGMKVNNSTSCYELLESILKAFDLMMSSNVSKNYVMYIYNKRDLSESGIKMTSIINRSTKKKSGLDGDEINKAMYAWLQFFSMRSSGITYPVNTFCNVTRPNEYDTYRSTIFGDWSQGHWLVASNPNSLIVPSVVAQIEYWIPSKTEGNTIYIKEYKIMSPSSTTWTIYENADGLYIQFLLTLTDGEGGKYVWSGTTDGSIELKPNPIQQMSDTIYNEFVPFLSYTQYQVDASDINTLGGANSITKECYYGNNHNISYDDFFDQVEVSFSKQNFEALKPSTNMSASTFVYSKNQTDYKNADGKTLVTKNTLQSQYMSAANWFSFYRNYNKSTQFDMFNKVAQRWFDLSERSNSDIMSVYYDPVKTSSSSVSNASASSVKIDYSTFPIMGYDTKGYKYNESRTRWGNILGDMLKTNVDAGASGQSDFYLRQLRGISPGRTGAVVADEGRVVPNDTVLNRVPIGCMLTQYTTWDGMLTTPNNDYNWNELYVFHTGWDFYSMMSEYTFWSTSHNKWKATLPCSWWSSDMLTRDYWKSEGAITKEYWKVYPYWRGWYNDHFSPKQPVLTWSPDEYVTFKASRDKRQYLLLDFNLLYQNDYVRISGDDNQTYFNGSSQHVSNKLYPDYYTAWTDEDPDYIKEAITKAGGLTTPLSDTGYQIDEKYTTIYNRYWDSDNYLKYLVDETGVVSGAYYNALADWHSYYNNGWPLIRAILRVGDKYWNGNSWSAERAIFDISFHDGDVMSEAMSSRKSDVDYKYVKTTDTLNETLSACKWLKIANNKSIVSSGNMYVMDKLNIPITSDLSGKITLELFMPEQPYNGQFQQGDRCRNWDGDWARENEADVKVYGGISPNKTFNGVAVADAYKVGTNNVYLNYKMGFNNIFMSNLELDYYQESTNGWMNTYDNVDGSKDNELKLVIKNTDADSRFENNKKSVSKSFLPLVETNDSNVTNYIYKLWSDGNVNGSEILDVFRGDDYKEYVRDDYNAAYNGKKLVYQIGVKCYGGRSSSTDSILKVYKCSGLPIDNADTMTFGVEATTWNIKEENKVLSLRER